MDTFQNVVRQVLDGRRDIYLEGGFRSQIDTEHFNQWAQTMMHAMYAGNSMREEVLIAAAEVLNEND